MKLKLVLFTGLMFIFHLSVIDINAYENLYLDSNIKVEEIMIEGKTNKLLKEYTYPNEALKEAKDKYKDVFDFVKKKYTFNDITKENYKKYQDKINLCFGENLLDEKYYFPVLTFFDIFENTDENAEIKEIVSNHDSNSKNFSRYDTDSNSRLVNLLPMNNPYVIDHNEPTDIGIAEYNAVYNNSNDSKPEISTFVYLKEMAIAYAAGYAENPNNSYNYYEGADCTNFVSQIAFNGGKMYVDRGNYNREKGWWHTPLSEPTQIESISWIRADSFVKFWGTQLETTSFRTLSSNVRSGDYISIDMGDDGKWDHCGFVTQWENVERTYTYKFPISSSSITMKYHDFKIAQHTSNVHDWVSSERINWEGAGPEAANRGRYALIRRSYFADGQN